MDVHFHEMLRAEVELLAFGVEWAGGLGGSSTTFSHEAGEAGEMLKSMYSYAAKQCKEWSEVPLSRAGEDASNPAAGRQCAVSVRVSR